MTIAGLFFADLVRVVSTGTGTGPMALGAPHPGHRGFAGVVPEGASFPYAIMSVGGAAQWETGVGTLDEAGRLVRVPAASSAGGGAVAFAAGEKSVALTPGAGWLAAVDGHGHDMGGIAGLQAALDGKAASGHGHLGFDMLAMGAGSAAAPAIGFAADGDTGLFRPAADSLAIATGGVERLRVNAAGHLGLGTDDPAARLDIAAGNIDLDLSTSGHPFGMLTKDGTRFLHDFNHGPNGTVTTNGRNLFLGRGAGNLTMGATATQSYQASNNVGIGQEVLQANGNGHSNTAIGSSAMYVNISGTRNAAMGWGALFSNSSGSSNVAIGYAAGRYLADGTTPLSSCNMSIYIGDSARALANAASNEMVLGHDAVGAGSNSVTLGNASVTVTVLRGDARPGADNARSLGTSAHRWSVVYAATGSINTSDERDKQDVGAVPDAWLDAWGDVGWGRYRFREAVARKGEDARWHIGLVAQQVHGAFAARGLDAFAIGLCCRDPVDEEGRTDRWGLRYTECLALEAAWQRRTIDQMAARIARLEA